MIYVNKIFFFLFQVDIFGICIVRSIYIHPISYVIKLCSLFKNNVKVEEIEKNMHWQEGRMPMCYGILEKVNIEESKDGGLFPCIRSSGIKVESCIELNEGLLGITNFL